MNHRRFATAVARVSMRAALFAASAVSMHCSVTLGDTSSHWPSGPATVLGIAAFDSGLARVSIDVPAGYTGTGVATTQGIADAGPPGMARGTLVPVASGGAGAGASMALTGTFDATTGSLSVNGGSYSITGNATSTGVTGFANGPTGPGAYAGMPGGTILCGAFQGSFVGVVGFVFESDGHATAIYAAQGSRGTSQGTMTGGKVSFSEPITFNGHNLTIEGSYGGSSAQGTWSDTTTTKGTWSAGTCP
jgi:hypothetical protein